MATGYISWFKGGGQSTEGIDLPVPRFSGMTTEKITVSGTSAQSVTTAADHKTFIRIYVDADSWALAGTNPTAAVPSAGASASGIFIPSSTVVDLYINKGDKVAIIGV